MKVEIKSVYDGSVTQILYVDGEPKVRSNDYIALAQIKEEIEKENLNNN
jgi:hypothetical protein